MKLWCVEYAEGQQYVVADSFQVSPEGALEFRSGDSVVLSVREWEWKGLRQEVVISIKRVCEVCGVTFVFYQEALEHEIQCQPYSCPKCGEYYPKSKSHVCREEK